MTVYYEVDGKTYSYELDEQKVLNSIDTEKIKNSVSGDFVKWNNSAFDFNIYMPTGFGDGNFNGFDLRYQNTANALTYLSNISKSNTKEDFDRWYGLYKETIENELLYQTNILTKEIERFKTDYGTITDNISNKINEVVGVANDTKNFISTFASMASAVALLTQIASILVPIGIIVGTIEGLNQLVKTLEFGKRQESIITQANKVEKLIEAYKDDSLYNTLNRFEEKLPKRNFGAGEADDFLSKYKYVIIAFVIIIAWWWYKNKN